MNDLEKKELSILRELAAAAMFQVLFRPKETSKNTQTGSLAVSLKCKQRSMQTVTSKFVCRTVYT